MAKLEPIRIQKLLSQQGICSRRECEGWIRSQWLKINGKTASLGDRATVNDTFEVKGKPLKLSLGKKINKQVLAFYKPRGVECTLKAEEASQTLADYDFGGRFFSIGRLDKDSHGLLLMTNDGDLANKLAHPRYQKEKEYLVKVDKKITPSFLKLMAGGVEIEGVKTLKCKVDQRENKIFSIILTQGRNRQIRKMCEALGFTVMDLLRIRVGNIFLGEMKAGKWRVLSDVELKGLKKH